MKTPAIDSELAIAIAYHVLAKHGDRKSDRNTLAEGAEHKIELQLSGTIDGTRVELPIEGNLVVGQDNPTGTTYLPKEKAILCAALDIMAKTRRERLVESLKDGVPDPDPEMLGLVEAIRQRLKTTGNKRGSVSFRATQ